MFSRGSGGCPDRLSLITIASSVRVAVGHVEVPFPLSVDRAAADLVLQRVPDVGHGQGLFRDGHQVRVLGVQAVPKFIREGQRERDQGGPVAVAQGRAQVGRQAVVEAGPMLVLSRMARCSWGAM